MPSDAASGAVAAATASGRRGPAGLGWILMLAVIAVASIASLPWTLARDDAGRLRHERTDLDAALLPPWWSPHRPEERAVLESLAAARGEAPRPWLGTDRLGRDLLARTLLGGAVSLAVGFGAAAVATLIGTTVGSVAGMSGAAGGRLDAVLMRLVDVVQGLPSILLVVLVGLSTDGLLSRATWDPGPVVRQAVDLLVLVVAIGGVSWLTMARVIRGRALGLARAPFMEATVAVGMGPARRLVRHLVPNLAGTIAAYAALAVPAAILSETFLSFLGLGVREPLPSWGSLAAAGIAEVSPVRTRWWLLAVPCLMVAAVLVSMHAITEGLRHRAEAREMRGDPA
ncbi:MAG: ABC transporter permease [Planctomycetota bacterium]|jgi:ABC-type dipeptide/oligopeptide/nickel transport system permease subunit